MKKFLLNVGVALMACVAVTSCSDDNDSIATYPALGYEAGVWTGIIDETSYSCDIHLGKYESAGEYAFVTIASPEETTYFNGQGAYTYNQTSGTITINLNADEPITATLQYEDLSGDAITVTVGEQTYKMKKATYPTSIAGKWAISTTEEEVTTTTEFEFFPVALPVRTLSVIATTTVGDEVTTEEGTYVYSNETGVATLTFADETEIVMTVNSKLATEASITVEEAEAGVVSRIFTAEAE